jgi:hypothetical protein
MRRPYNSTVEIEIGAKPAAASRARAKCAGNCLPRFAARRRIPEQARGLKKYRRGGSDVSKISDKDDTASALRDGTSV